MAKAGTPQGRRSLAALASLAVLAVVAAGCGGGGGGDTESESAARQQLEDGATKVSKATSLRMSLLFEVEEDGDSREIGCLDMAVDTRKPERLEMNVFDLNCSGGSESHGLIAVGRHAWGSTEPGSWRAATITPELLRQLDDEQTDFSQLTKAAENIHVDPDGAAVEEGNGKFVDVTNYTFEAPASAFPSSSSDDLGDVEVEFEAAVDHHGYLRELVVHGDEDGTGATVTATYEDFDKNPGITPPDPAEVEGPTTSIHTREEFDALFGVPSS